MAAPSCRASILALAEPAQQVLEREHFLDPARSPTIEPDLLGVGGPLSLPADRREGFGPAPPPASAVLSADKADRAAACAGRRPRERVCRRSPLLVSTVALMRGRMRITSRPRVSMRSAEPSASITSTDWVLPSPTAAPRRRRAYCERADRAEIDHVALQLRGHRVLKISGDLHVLAAPDWRRAPARRRLRSRKTMKRVQWMQRVMMVLTSGPIYLS